MDIECILHKELEHYLRSDRYRYTQFLPITRHRGLSHVNNPHARPDDLVLINIYKDGKIEAYGGFLPDTFIIKGRKHHVGWISCIWVNPAMRGKGIAKKIMTSAYNYWGENLLSTKPSPQAKGLFISTNRFQVLTFENTLKCHRQLNLALFLPKRNNHWKIFYPFFKLIDFSFNTFLNSISFFLKKETNSILSVERISKIDDNILTFINTFQKDVFIKKRIKDFEWHRKFPWVKNTQEAKEDQVKYHFSSYANSFENIYLKFLNKNEIVGLLVLTIRDNELKIPLVYFNSNNVTVSKSITEYLFDFMENEKISTIETAHPILKKIILEKKNTFFLKRNIKREYLFSNQLVSVLKDIPICLQDGDGDAVFT